MKILVTGAAGFVGSHVLKRLKELEIDVYGIDNFSSYYSVEYKDLRLEYLGLTRGSDVITCDISDFKQVSEMISGIRPDYIIHLAAQAGVRLSLKDSSSYISANIAGFENITRSSIEDESQQSPEAFSSAYHDNLRDPPTDSSSCDSEDIEAVARLSHDKLLSLVEVGTVFALRCAFDHWSRVALYKRSLLILERHSIAFKKMECVSNHVTMRWALSTIVSLFTK